MRINLWWARRWVAFILIGVIPLTMFILLLFAGFDLLLATVIALLFIPAVGFIARRTLLSHPFIDYLEGKGLIVKTLDSTGLIKTFLVDLHPPFLRGRIGNVEVEDVFDRQAMFYETPPIPTEAEVQREVMEENGETKVKEYLVVKIPRDEAHILQFKEHVYPVFFWNENLKTFLTKESIAKLETDTLLDHALLYLVRKIEELDKHLRDFARHVVDLTRPQGFNLFEMIRRHPIATILVIILIAIAAAIYFVPGLVESLAGAATPTTTPATPPPAEGAVVAK